MASSAWSAKHPFHLSNGYATIPSAPVTIVDAMPSVSTLSETTPAAESNS